MAANKQADHMVALVYLTAKGLTHQGPLGLAEHNAMALKHSWNTRCSCSSRISQLQGPTVPPTL